MTLFFYIGFISALFQPVLELKVDTPVLRTSFGVLVV